jgi:hypothetical protein
MKLTLLIISSMFSLNLLAKPVSVYAEYTTENFSNKETISKHYEVQLDDEVQQKLKERGSILCHHYYERRMVHLNIYLNKDSTIKATSQSYGKWSEESSFPNIESLYWLNIYEVKVVGRIMDTFHFHGGSRRSWDNNYEKVNVLKNWKEAVPFEDKEGLVCHFR